MENAIHGRYRYSLQLCTAIYVLVAGQLFTMCGSARADSASQVSVAQQLQPFVDDG